MYCTYIHLRKTDWTPYYVGSGTEDRPYNFKTRTKEHKKQHIEYGTIVLILGKYETKKEAIQAEYWAIRDLLKESHTLVNQHTGTVVMKEEILKFTLEHGRIPSRTKLDEKYMYWAMSSYCRESHQCYDSEFRKVMCSYGFGSRRHPVTVLNRKDEIRRFIHEHGKIPSRREPKLRTWMIGYTAPSSLTYDQEFRKEMESFGFGKKKGKHNITS